MGQTRRRKRKRESPFPLNYWYKLLPCYSYVSLEKEEWRWVYLENILSLLFKKKYPLTVVMRAAWWSTSRKQTTALGVSMPDSYIPTPLRLQLRLLLFHIEKHIVQVEWKESANRSENKKAFIHPQSFHLLYLVDLGQKSVTFPL